MGPIQHKTESTGRRRLIALLLLTLLAPPPALANPQGGNVVAGEAQIDHQGRNTHITAGDRSIIEWQSFNVGRHESVEFVQPGSWARVLNRVTTPDPTQIMGRLSANGQVYIANPYGVYFGNSAVVDVARLVAGAGNVSNDDFLAGIDRFSGLQGRVENHGFLNADAVTLVGQQVANHGRIVARDGDLMMLAGDEIWITEHGSPVLIKVPSAAADPGPEAGPAVANHGRLEAGRGRARLAAGDWISLAIHNTGTVRAQQIALEGGEDSIVEVAGRLDASDTTPGRAGGSIEVLGDHVRLRGALLDASGDAGGGTVLVGGEAHGEGERRSARDTYVSPDSEIRADALRDGDGGEIVVWSDEATYAYGKLSARGGAEAGDGGFVETSGGYLDVRRAPDLRGPAGHGGEWLIDPTNVVITDTANTPPADPEDTLNGQLEFASPLWVNTVRPPADGSTTAMLGTDIVEESLAQGASVTVSTRTQDDAGSRSADVGDITVASEIVIEDDPGILEGTEATLELRAANHIYINERIETESQNLELSVALQANDPLQPDNDIRKGNVNINAPIRTGGGSIDARGVNTIVDVPRAMGKPEDVEPLGIETDGGRVLLLGGMVLDEPLGDVLVAGGVTVKSRLVTTGGDVTIDSLGGSSLVQAAITTAGGEGQGAVRILTEETSTDPLMLETRDITTGGGNIEMSGRVTTITTMGHLDSAGGDVNIGDDITVAGQTIAAGVTAQVDVQGRIDSAGGDVMIRSNPVADTESVVGVSIAAPIDTGGGDLVAWSVADAATVTIGGTITTAGGAEDATGDVSIGYDPDFADAPASDVVVRETIVAMGEASIRGRNVSVESGADITASSLQLRAGQGSSDGVLALDAAGTGLTLAANQISLENVGVTEVQEAIAVNGTRFTSADDPAAAPAQFALFQGPSIADAALPAADRFGSGGPAGMGYTIESANGMIVIETASKVTGTDLHLISADTFTTDVNIRDKLSPNSIELVSDQALTVTKQLADFIQPVPVGESDEAPTITLHAGASGTGNLTFEPVADLVLEADEITLRAGAGPDGTVQEMPAFVDAANDTTLMSPIFKKTAGSSEPLKFTLQQDGQLTADLVPAPEQFVGGTAGVDYTLRSDLDAIAVESALTAKLGGTNLTLLSAESFMVAEGTSAAVVETARIGGVEDFQVTQAVLDAIAFQDPTKSRLTLSAGLRESDESRSGDLSFAGPAEGSEGDHGVTARANVIRLEGTQVNAIVGNPLFENTSSNSNPERFEIFQTASLQDTASLPSASQFGRGNVAMLDYQIQSQGRITLSTADRFALADLTLESLGNPDFAVASEVTLSNLLTRRPDRTGPRTLDVTADFVTVEETTGDDLSFDTLSSTLDARSVVLRASDGPEGATPVVLADNPRLELIFDESPSLVIRQDGTVRADDLPSPSQFQTAGGTGIPAGLDYELHSDEGRIVLAASGLEAVEKVRDSHLSLSAVSPASPLPGESAIDFGTQLLELSSLVATASGDLLIGSGTRIHTTGTTTRTTVNGVITTESIGFDAGVSDADGGDLSFDEGVHLEASSGKDTEAIVALTARAGLSREGRVDARDDDPSFQTDVFRITQSASLSDGLLTDDDGNVAPAGIPRRDQINSGGALKRYELSSSDRVVVHEAGNLSSNTERIDIIARSIDYGAETVLDFPSETILQAEEIALRGGTRIEGAANDNLQLRLLSQGDMESPAEFVFDQGSAVDGQALPRLSQFIPNQPIHYTVRSGGAIEVDEMFVNRVVGTSLTLETEFEEGVSITSDLVLEAPLDGFDPSLEILAETTIDTARIETEGDQVYAKKVVVKAGQTTLTGQNITFGSAAEGGTVEPDVAGGNSLAITADGEVTFYGDVGREMNPLDQLEIDLSQGSGTVRFAKSGTGMRQEVRANDILLNPNGRLPASEATIFRNQDDLSDDASEPPSILFQGDLAFIAEGGSFTMGSGEMLSVPGTLEIEATGGTATLGDLSAENIYVQAERINIVRRGGTELRTSGGAFVNSPSTAIVGNEIRFADPSGEDISSIGRIGDGNDPIFGIPDPFDPPSFLALLPPEQQLATFAIDGAFQRVGPGSLGLGNTALSLTPLGPSQALYTEALWTLSPVPEVARPADAKRLDPSPLLKIGIAPRATTALEFHSWLDGAAIYDDVAIGVARRNAVQHAALAPQETPGGASAVPIVVAIAEPRLQGDETERALYFYDRVLGPERENASRIRSVLQAALDDYIATTGMRRVVGFELRRFVRNRPSSQFDAYQVLEDLDVLFRYHRRSGLAPAEYELIQTQWLAEMKPEGITLEQFGQTIHPSRYVRGSDILDIFGD